MRSVKAPFLSGRWYVVATCHYCQHDHVLFEDLTNGKARLNATYQWTCPTCRREGKYDGEHLKRYQHVPKQKRSNSPKSAPRFKTSAETKTIDRRKRKGKAAR